MASNADTKIAAFYTRWHRLESERRDLAEDIRELRKEMLSAGIPKSDIPGVALAVRRSFESDKARVRRLSAEELAAALGPFADSPLGSAAVRAVA